MTKRHRDGQRIPVVTREIDPAAHASRVITRRDDRVHSDTVREAA